MHRFYLPTANANDRILQLTNGEAHHAASVLRVRCSDRVTVLNGNGDLFLCEVKEVIKRMVTLQTMEHHFVPALPYKLTLIQAITKGKSMDVIIQKAAELGVDTVIPLQSERSVSHVEEDNSEAKTEKWQATAIEALKQCGSAWLTRIRKPVKLSEILAQSSLFDLSLIAALLPEAHHPRKCIESFLAKSQGIPSKPAVWIGPEGDFSETELKQVLATGAHPINLGRWTLRSETAAICAVNIVNYELQAPR